MAYRSNRGRSRSRQSKGEPATSPHAPIRVVSVIVAFLLLAFRLPGMTVVCLGFLTARFTARRPFLSGKWPNGRPRADNEGERRLEASYRRASRWLSGGLLPSKPDAMLGVIAACLDWGWLTLMVPDAMWRWGLAVVDASCAYLTVMGSMAAARDMTCTVKGLDTRMRRRRTAWAKNRLKPILAGMGAAVIPGVLIMAATGRLWPIPMLMAVGALLPMIPVMRADRRRFRDDYASALMVWDWLARLDKPPVKGMPGPVTGTETGGDGSRVFLMGVPNAAEWANDATVKTFTPVAQADGMLPGFAYDGQDRTRVAVAVCPADPPDPGALLADPVMLKARLMVDETRMGGMYGAFPGRIVRLRKTAERDGRPCLYSFALDGTNADWDMISRDWLKGAASGRFGDWMNMERVTVLADPGGSHGWVSLDEDWDSMEFDPKAMIPLMEGGLTRRRDDPARYMRLIREDRELKRVFEGALDPARLPAPDTIWHDTRRFVASRDGWRIEIMACSIRRGLTVGQYMKPDLRPAFGESRLADVIPWVENHRPRSRMFMFVHAPGCEENLTLPASLRDVTGSDEASLLLARAIACRACATVLKTPPILGEATRLTRHGSLWRIPVRLEGGLTAGDVRRAAERLKSMMGADTLLMEWRDSGLMILWCGGPVPDDPHEWLDMRQHDRIIRLRLDEAWAASRAVGADGRPVTTMEVGTGGGRLIRASFGLPAGLGVDGAMGRLDAFRATSGYSYARRVNGNAPLTLLLSHGDPLPERAPADWGMMAAEPGSTRLPFAVGDDGGTVFYDPHDTAHLLVTGQTMSGKTSAAVTLVNAALLHGWHAYVGDPVKSGNDFAPVKSKLNGFATGLDDCTGMLRWLDMEGRRRLDLQKRYGVQNVDGLPDDVRPPRIIIFLDEFVSLLELSRGAKRNPTGDPDIDNENLLEAWRDNCKKRIGAAVSHILTQHRSQGITLILGSQMMKTESMDALPDAGLAKSQMGRLFIGAGDVNGNVSQQNVREGNRLIRQAMDSGGMPKGRGLYERMGRGLQMVQCWWCGPGPEVAEHMASVPDAPPDDWTDLIPAPPKLVGVQETMPAEPDRTVSVKADDGDDWVLD